MRLHADLEPIVEDDAAIRAALDDVDVPPLLATVAQITGDHTVLREHLRPKPDALLDPAVGLTILEQAEARDLAAAALVTWRDAGCPAPEPLALADLEAIIEFLVGDDAASEYLTLLEEELALDGEDRRAPTWHKDDVAPERDFRVAVVGAGMSGIVAAHRLQQAGVPFVIFEKNPDVGGTWFENTYPGCRVDVPNHVYSYSFAQTPDWPGFFSDQQVLLEYFRTCADELGLRPHIRFETEVVGAELDEETQEWVVRVRAAGGAEETLRFHAIVSAVGQLNRPSFPDIPGRERYAGDWFHSARWDDSIALDGRRVGIIGTGASAAQFIPAVAERASETIIFQRTPPWLVPTPNYHDGLPAGMRWLLHHVPEYARWDRLWLFWRGHEGLLPMARVDPEWDDGGRTVSGPNDLIRQLLTAFLQIEVPDPEVFAKVLPSYPPIAKRIVRDNGVYARALQRDDVELVTTGIAEITEKGIRTVDGVEHEFDVLIYGTGFQASHFLTPMRLRGRGGVDLHERWDGDARAYLGIVVPEFPNLFLFYGPNTNIVINGSIVYFSECEADYLLACLRRLLEAGDRSLECRAEVHDAYNERIDAGNRAMAWGASDVNTWYKNAKGRVAQNWPFSLLEYWQQTRAVNDDDYLFR
jgi:4-hydroxyacetophenone monooxygenase